MLALHLRGSDKLRNEAPTNAQVRRVEDMMAHTQTTSVFLCSDDPAWKQEVEEELRRRQIEVYTYPAQLSSDEGRPGTGVGVHFNPGIPAWKPLQDMSMELGVFREQP